MERIVVVESNIKNQVFAEFGNMAHRANEDPDEVKKNNPPEIWRAMRGLVQTFGQPINSRGEVVDLTRYSEERFTFTCPLIRGQVERTNTRVEIEVASGEFKHPLNIDPLRDSLPELKREDFTLRVKRLASNPRVYDELSRTTFTFHPERYERDDYDRTALINGVLKVGDSQRLRGVITWLQKFYGGAPELNEYRRDFVYAKR